MLGRLLLEILLEADTVRRKRKRRLYAASAAAAMLALAAGMTSLGGAERIASIIEQAVGGRRIVKVNSDKENKISENEDEKEVYQKLKEVFGTEPVRMYNQKKGMSFVRADLDENLQIAELLYQYNEKNFWFITALLSA